MTEFTDDLVAQLNRLEVQVDAHWLRKCRTSVVSAVSQCADVLGSASAENWPDINWGNWNASEGAWADWLVAELTRRDMKEADWESLGQLIPIAREWHLPVADVLEALQIRYESAVPRHWGAQRRPRSLTALHV